MNWRGRLTPRARARDIARELQDHLDLEAEELGERGQPREDARAAARRLFGNPTVIAEDLREMHGTPHLDRLAQDVRYGLRTLRRTPGVTAIAIGSAALGIAACSVIFSILDTAFLKPLAVEDPTRLVRVSELDRRTGEIGGELSYPDFLDLRQATDFDGGAASAPPAP